MMWTGITGVAQSGMAAASANKPVDKFDTNTGKRLFNTKTGEPIK